MHGMHMHMHMHMLTCTYTCTHSAHTHCTCTCETCTRLETSPPRLHPPPSPYCSSAIVSAILDTGSLQPRALRADDLDLVCLPCASVCTCLHFKRRRCSASSTISSWRTSCAAGSPRSASPCSAPRSSPRRCSSGSTRSAAHDTLPASRDGIEAQIRNLLGLESPAKDADADLAIGLAIGSALLATPRATKTMSREPNANGGRADGALFAQHTRAAPT